MKPSFVFLFGITASLSVSASEPILIPLISGSNCTLAGDILRSCKFEAKYILPSGINLKFIPLRNRIEVQAKGNCSTAFPVAVSISTGAEPEDKLDVSLVRTEASILRSKKGLASDGLTIKLANNWLENAYFSRSCLSFLRVWQDELDFDSEEQVLTFLSRFSDGMSESVKVKSVFNEVILYRPAFTLLKTVSETLLSQLNTVLSNDVIDPSGEVVDLLEQMKSSAAFHLSLSQRESVSKLQDFIEMQAASTTWKGKTLGDFFNANDATALKKITDLPAKITISEEDLKKYSLDILERCENLKQLKLMLPKKMLSDSVQNKISDLSRACEVDQNGANP